MANRSLEKERQTFQNWWVLTDKQREQRGLPTTQTGMAQLLGIHYYTIQNWNKEMREGNSSAYAEGFKDYASWLLQPEEDRDPKTEAEFASSIGVSLDVINSWNEQLRQTDSGDELERFRQQVYAQAMKKNATAKHMELYARIKGLFDKQEEKVEKNGADYTREGLAAIRELEGMAQVPVKPGILHKELHLPAGQGTDENPEV
jgi:DNA-binding transcriptional regulator YiaG